MKFWGYKRPDDSVGIRNFVMILPASRCTNEIAFRIAEEAGPGVVAIPHTHNCVHLPSDRQKALRALAGFGMNPNVAATILVGVGCEQVSAEAIANKIVITKKPVEIFTIKQEGSYKAVIDKAILTARKLLSNISIIRKQLFDLKYLTLGVKCGGSGGLSGIGCNAVSGQASNIIIEKGGKVIFSETAEIVGAEQALSKRAANSKVAERVYEVSKRLQNRFREAGVDLTEGEPTPGNMKAGLTTMEEKSLGAIIKGGTSKLEGVLEWAEKPYSGGLYFMDGSAMTPLVYGGFAAAGAQLATFNMSSGIVTSFQTPPAGRGIPILPVIKIVNKPFGGDKEYYDITLDDVMKGQKSIDQAGRELLNEIIDVSSGKLTKMEMLPKYIEMLELYTTSPII